MRKQNESLQGEFAPPHNGTGQKMNHSQSPLWGGVLAADVVRNVRAASSEYRGQVAGILLREEAKEKSVDCSTEHQTGNDQQLKID
jgi:hypothetical protein